MADSLAPDEKLCPFCAETIKKAAIKCRYCGSDLEPEATAQPPVVEQRAERADSRDHADEPRAGFLHSARTTLALAAVCLLLVVGTGVTWWRTHHSDGGSGSGAITSTQARSAGLQQATTLTQKVLSYDWKSLDSDIKASEAVLAPSFRTEYAKAMSGVRDKTLKNQVTLVAKVVATSIVSASDSKVVALVFVNQTTTAKGTANQRLDQNRVLVTLTRHDGQWRVSKMDAF